MELKIKVERDIKKHGNLTYTVLGEIPAPLADAGYDCGRDFARYLTNEVCDPSFGEMVICLTITETNPYQGNGPSKWLVDILEKTPYAGEMPYVSDFKGTKMFDKPLSGVRDPATHNWWHD